jgi:hypothetical protein
MNLTGVARIGAAQVVLLLFLESAGKQSAPDCISGVRISNSRSAVDLNLSPHQHKLPPGRLPAAPRRLPPLLTSLFLMFNFSANHLLLLSRME